MNIDPNILTQLLIQLPPLLLSLTLHELAHGWVANELGDPTAKNAGRLSLNPLKHLDPLGVLFFVVAKIGWAKPVPVDPRYFKNPQKDMLKVALAGPATNVVLAVASAVLVQVVVRLALVDALPLPLGVIRALVEMLAASVWINIVLAVFNLLPMPPLDGSRILMGLLPPRLAVQYARMETWGMILVLVLWATGILGWIITPVIRASGRLLLG